MLRLYLKLVVVVVVIRLRIARIVYMVHIKNMLVNAIFFYVMVFYNFLILFRYLHSFTVTFFL